MIHKNLILTQTYSSKGILRLKYILFNIIISISIFLWVVYENFYYKKLLPKLIPPLFSIKHGMIKMQWFNPILQIVPLSGVHVCFFRIYVYRVSFLLDLTTILNDFLDDRHQRIDGIDQSNDDITKSAPYFSSD